jgi:hypothetical protein
MIVFDLQCTSAHVFEAWFGSTGDYEAQKQRGLLSCPICGDEKVEKAVMAPAVGAKGNRSESRSVAVAGGDPEQAKALLKALADLQRSILDKSEYVGTRFADEARAIHHGDSEARGIYGETTPEVAAELRDEGIAAVPLIFPVRPRGSDA